VITLLHGDARDMLQTLPTGSVQCVITSPPYFGLRAYGDDPREIGREATPAAYVAALIAVFAEVWRVLRDDGTLWVNLGDSYVASPAGNTDATWSAKQASNVGSAARRTRSTITPGLPAKNLLGIPWRVAFALQDAGWILRSDIIWAKPNPMPESVRDRPTRAHEYLFLFAKRQRYFYDAEAIAEAATQHGQGSLGELNTKKPAETTNGRGATTLKDPDRVTRNRRSVWTIATQPYAGAHFATMPEALVEPCILAGSASQACETCGAAWGRVTKDEDGTMNDESGGADSSSFIVHRSSFVPGFAPRCRCATNTGAARSICLDPFLGSGTVARVAERFGRDAIGIDLHAEYLELQEKRTDGVQVEFTL
jgi:DNA modification methylase